MKRQSLLWLAAILLSLLAAFPARAAPSTYEPLPPPPQGPSALHDQFPLEAWTLDGSNIDDVATHQARLTVNQLGILRAWAVKLSIRIGEQSLGPRPSSTLAEVTGSMASDLTANFWDQSGSPLVLGGIALTGLWAMVLWLSRRRGGGWRMILNLAFTLVVSAAVLANLGELLGGLEEASTGLARVGFAAATRPLGQRAADQQIGHVGERVWRKFVHDPWVAGEFTNAEAAERYSSDGLPGGKLIKMSATQRLNHYQSLGLDDREKLFAPWGVNQLTSRWLLGVTSLIAAGAWASATLLLSGALIFYDLLLLVLAALTPLVMLLALWPPVGTRLVTMWGGRVLAVAINKVVAGVLLGVFLTLSNALLAIAEAGGWPLAASLQVILVLAVVRFRLYSPVTALTALAWVRQAAPGSQVQADGGAVRGRSVQGLPSESSYLAPHRENASDLDLLLQTMPQRPAGVLSSSDGHGGVEAAVRELGSDLTRVHRSLLQRTTRPTVESESPGSAKPDDMVHPLQAAVPSRGQTLLDQGSSSDDLRLAAGDVPGHSNRSFRPRVVPPPAK